MFIVISTIAIVTVFGIIIYCAFVEIREIFREIQLRREIRKEVAK